MVTDNNYENSIYENWYIDKNGSPVAKYIVDIKQVSTTDNLVQLTNVPYIIDKMQVKASDGITSTDLYRVYNMDEIVNNANAYYLSASGMMNFNPAQAGKTFTFQYYGAGVELISVDRIFYKNSENVIEILGYLITQGYEGLKYLADIGDVKTVINKIETDITNGNNTATRIETAITNGDLNTINNNIQKNTDDIKNMQIGTRNYFLNTKTNYLNNVFNTLIPFDVSNDFKTNAKGNYLTISAWFEGQYIYKDNGHYGVGLKITYEDTTIQWLSLDRNYISTLENPSGTVLGKRYFATIKCDNKKIVNIDNAVMFINNMQSVSNFIIKDIMIEIASKPSDCVEAPEDIQKQIDNLNNLTTNTAMVNTITSSSTYKNDLASKADKLYVDKLVPISKGKCKFIAHRGLNACCPENTLPAYVKAGQFGFYGGETDVTTTSDGIWILMHDDTVDRMTSGTGNVSSLTLAQIRALNIDTGNNVNAYPNLKIPTFEEYLITCKKNGLVPIIEIKTTADITKIQNLILILRTYDVEYHSVIISSRLNLLQEVRKYSSVKLQYIVNTITTDTITSVVALGNAGIDSSYSSVTPQNIIDCHNAGIEVNAWTVDDFDACLQLVNWGVDYITSNKIGGVE